MDMYDFSDEDEDALEFIGYERTPYRVRERTNPIEDFDDTDFFTRFRLRKPTVLFILEQIEELIETPTDWNHSVSPINQLLLTLRFYATGGFLITVGDVINISKAASSNIVKKVTDAITSLAPRYIKMPSTPAEIRELQLSFYQRARMPRFIGSIDCTHIRIQSPGGGRAELFRNRKGYFSINTQTKADVDLKVLDVVARWPGSAHDQTIFDNSSIRNRLENNEFGDSIIVGDSGYRNTTHVITPLLQANTVVEQLYNESARRTRNPVERQYGVLKRRFPVLSIGLRLKLNTSLAVVVACAVLHNIAIDHKEEMPDDEPNIIGLVNFEEEINVEQPEEIHLHNARQNLLNDYFQRLANL